MMVVVVSSDHPTSRQQRTKYNRTNEANIGHQISAAINSFIRQLADCSRAASRCHGNQRTITHTHTHVHIFIYLFIYLFICVTYKLGRVVTSTRCNELPCQRQRRFTMESGSAETFRARFLFVESEVSPQTVPFNKDGFLFLFLLIFWSVPCRW